MGWEVEYENGQPVRMWWTGPDEQTFGRALEAERSRCKECGFPLGWHKPACSLKGVPVNG
jgi:hypothetical protein